MREFLKKKVLLSIIVALTFVVSIMTIFVNSPNVYAADLNTVVLKSTDFTGEGEGSDNPWTLSNSSWAISNLAFYNYWNKDEISKTEDGQGSAFSSSITYNNPSKYAIVSVKVYGAGQNHKNTVDVSVTCGSETTAAQTVTKDGTDLAFNLSTNPTSSVVINFQHPAHTDTAKIELVGTDKGNVTFIEITTKTVSQVSISSGTGVKSVYLSTNQTAKSGSASGTEFNIGSTVYGFAELARGYSAQSGWTLVSGTANTEGAKYRVSSVKAGTSNFGKINASLITYNITYNLAGGTHGSTHPATYNVTTNTFTISNPTKTGYTFTGWTGSNGTTPQTNVSVAKGSIGNKSYTANWTANQYTVTLDMQNGTGGSSSVTATYNSAMPTMTVPTRTGFTFGGYYTEENGGGTQYYNANGESTKNWDKASATTLYAKWTLLPVIQEVVDKINTIGGQTNVAYPQSKASIEAAEAAYKALIEEYPEYASAISDKYLELQNDRTTYEDTKENLVNDAIAKINAIGNVSYTEASKGLIDSADLAYAKLTDEDKALVTNSLILAQANTDYDSVDEVVNNQNAIAFEYSDTAKDAIDIARSGYNDLSEYQKSIYPQESLNELVEYENAYDVMDKINNIEIVNNNSTKQKIIAAREALTALTAEELALVDLSFVNDLENDERAFEVIETINDINKPKYTKESKDLIDNARASYDALSDEQKALVVNYTTLTKDEDDYQRVDEVAKEINEIGHIRYDDSSNNKIKDARESYKSLSKDQKAFFPVSEQESLQNYEESYKVLEKIYSIGNVEYNNKSQKLIDDARKAYDSLTDEQKALIDSDDFNVLVTSEDDFSSKDSNVKWLFIVILIVCYAVIALAGIIRIIVAHKRNKDDENDNDNYNVKITIY